jgi:hypothetical protein
VNRPIPLRLRFPLLLANCEKLSKFEQIQPFLEECHVNTGPLQDTWGVEAEGKFCEILLPGKIGTANRRHSSGMGIAQMDKYTNKAATAGHTGERDLAPARAVNVLADLCNCRRVRPCVVFRGDS